MNRSKLDLFVFAFAEIVVTNFYYIINELLAQTSEREEEKSSKMGINLLFHNLPVVNHVW
jgi:hypothetical protein